LAAILALVFFPPGRAFAESKKVVFGYSTIGAMAAGSWMAKEIGAYEKYGIDAELIYISSGPTVVQALLGGDVMGGIAATNAVIAAVLRGAPLVSVISTANRPYHRFWVRPEINRLEDLKGKTLGVTRFGSVTDNLTRMVLKKYGLEGAVNVRQMGGTAEVGAAFQNKQIAGAVTSSLRVDSSVQPRLLLKLEDMGFQYSMDVVAYSRDDVKRFQAIPGIGLKTAQRVVLELKAKLADASFASGDGLTARDALVELGWTLLDAEHALADVDDGLPVEEQVVSLYAGTQGFLDTIPVEHVRKFETEMLDFLRLRHKNLLDSIATTKVMNDETTAELRKVLQSLVDGFKH